MKAMVESMSSINRLLSYSLKTYWQIFSNPFLSAEKNGRRNGHIILLNYFFKIFTLELEKYNSRKQISETNWERNLRKYKLWAGGKSPKRQTAKSKFLKRQPPEKTNSWRDKLLKRKTLEEKNSRKDKLL